MFIGNALNLYVGLEKIAVLIFNIQICEHRMPLHLFIFFQQYFVDFFSTSCIFIFIVNHFILYDVIMNKIIFLLLFFVCY